MSGILLVEKRGISMRSKRNRNRKPIDETTAAIDEIMDKMFTQARAQFGSAIKGVWFYDGDLCPGCLQRPISTMNFKGEEALAINGFMYRARGVLIGYFLCETCALHIFREAERHPYQQTPLHADIEHNLAAAYHKHLASLDA
jgi:hypothetical protein